MKAPNLVVVLAIVAVRPDDPLLAEYGQGGAIGIGDVVRNEVASNLESLSYVRTATVLNVKPKEVKHDNHIH
jgi:hypothetical protein